MTSKRVKNKEVRYQPQTGSVTGVLTTFCGPLYVIRVHTHGQIESICFVLFVFFYIVLISVIPHKIVFKSLRSDDLRSQKSAYNHLVIRVSVLCHKLH